MPIYLIPSSSANNYNTDMKQRILAALKLKGATVTELNMVIYPENTLQQDNKPIMSQSKLK